MLQLLVIAVRNLAQHRRRTALLGGAIAGVTLLLVLLVGLSAGIRGTMMRSATTVMTGHVNVAGFYKPSAGQAGALVTRYPGLLALLHREVPGVAFITARGRGWAKLVADSGASIQAGLGGVELAREKGFAGVLRPVEGRLEDLARPGTLVLFEAQAEKLGVRVGDALTISAPTPRGTNNTVDVTVVAVVRDLGLMSNFGVFLPMATLRELYQLNDTTTGALLLYLEDPARIDEVHEHLRRVLPAHGYEVLDHDPQPFWMKFQKVTREEWTGQRLDVTTWEDETSFLQYILKALNGLSGLLIVVLLVIIAVGVMNTLWIAIRERTREIGTLRAIGMQRTRVLAMFLLEAAVLGAVSSALGAALATGAAAALNAADIRFRERAVQMVLMSDRLVLDVQPGTVVAAALFVTACTTLISLLPSYLAARMKPVTAMHHIG